MKALFDQSLFYAAWQINDIRIYYFKLRYLTLFSRRSSLKRTKTCKEIKTKQTQWNGSYWMKIIIIQIPDIFLTPMQQQKLLLLLLLLSLLLLSNSTTSLAQSTQCYCNFPQNIPPFHFLYYYHNYQKNTVAVVVNELIRGVFFNLSLQRMRYVRKYTTCKYWMLGDFKISIIKCLLTLLVYFTIT